MLGINKFKRVALLDWGHGRVDPAGQYATAPNKMWDHGTGYSFHKEGKFYEGQWNYDFTMLVASKLEARKVPYILIYKGYADMPLQERVMIANWWGRKLDNKCFLISNHANASASHLARGYQIHTTRGETRADQLATIHWNKVNDRLGKTIRMRKQDSRDGDPDYEDNFYIIRKTIMPSVLNEWLFFDNPVDATLLMDEEVVNEMAEAQVEAILEYGML